MWVLGNVCALFVIPGSSWWLVNTWCRGGHRLWASRLESSTEVSCDRGRAIRFVVADKVCTQGKAIRFIPSLLTAWRPHIKMNGLLNIPVVRAQFKHVYQHCSNPGCPASSDVGNTISTKTRPSQDWGGAYMELKPPKNDPVLSEDLFIHYTVKDAQILKDRAVLNPVYVPPHPGGITEWRRLNVQGQSCWTL